MEVQENTPGQGCGNGDGKGFFHALGLGNSVSEHAGEGVWVCQNPDGSVSGQGTDAGTIYHCWINNDC